MGKSKNNLEEDGKLPQIGKALDTKKLVVREKNGAFDWLNLLDEEHADAIISDAFWYVICKICNPKPEFE